jgi:hypothetical protein
MVVVVIVTVAVAAVVAVVDVRVFVVVVIVAAAVGVIATVVTSAHLSALRVYQAVSDPEAILTAWSLVE